MMAEDIDKLIVDLKNPNLDVPGSMRALRHAASHALRAQQTRVSELEAERDRIARNRDMWKGQSERQAATIRGLRNSVHTAIIELAALVPNPRCVGNDDWPECLHAADRQCLTDAYDALDAVRSNTDTGPQAQVRAETGATVAPDSVDPTGLNDHLRALRNANEGFALVVWRASADGETGWDILSPKAAKEAESTLGWLMSIPGDVLMQSIPSIGTSGWLHAGEELQRERGAVAGQDGTMQDCALKGTGPAATLSESEMVHEQIAVSDQGNLQTLQETPTAASTASDVVKEVARVIEAAEREYRLTAGIDDHDEFIARAVLSSPPVLEMTEALQMLSEISATHEDRAFARSILSRFQSVGGDDVDARGGKNADR